MVTAALHNSRSTLPGKRAVNTSFTFADSGCVIHSGTASFEYHLQDRLVPPPPIPDAHVAFESSQRREILAEGSRFESFAQIRFPDGDVFARVAVHGLVQSTVDGKIGLSITGEIEERQPQ